MRIEIDCPDLAFAHELTQTPLPDGAHWEPLPAMPLCDDEAPIQAKEMVGEIAPVVVALVVGGDVLARVIAHFLIEALTRLREKSNHKDIQEKPQIRIAGFRVDPQEDTIVHKIEDIRKKTS